MANEAPRDFVQIAKEYAAAAIADTERTQFGFWIQQASKRFLDDLEQCDQDNSDFFFDEWHAKDVCDFIEKLPHVEGQWNTPEIVLHESHIFFLVQLFGFRKKEGIQIREWEGGIFYPRRFSTALFAVARKNAKSLLASSILNYCHCCEPEDGAQIISAATTFGQAKIVFDAAKKQVERTPELKEAFGLETWSKSITRLSTGSSFKPIHAKASTQDGLNPSHVSIDEVHAHKDSDLVNVLRSAAGARRNPLWLYTTTEGYTNDGVWSDLKNFAKSILKGAVKADHFLALIYALDDEDKTFGIEEDDEFDESKWIKANPLMTVNPMLLQSIREEAIEAKQMPSKLSEFRIKRLNRPASVSNGWVNLTEWNKCGGEIDLNWLEKYPCYGAIDLAQTMDIASFRLVWLVDGVVFTHGFRYVPADCVARRSARGTVPYQKWVHEGFLIETEGNIIDTARIEQDVVSCFKRFQVKRIAYDRWNATDLVVRLVNHGIPLIEFIQGRYSFHPAMRFLEEKYIAGKLNHGNDPVLNWHASNLVSRQDVNNNHQPDKNRSSEKIDDMVALIMACGICSADHEEEKDFNFLNSPMILNAK
jgi:phage terminase large subunit-like protein